MLNIEEAVPRADLHIMTAGVYDLTIEKGATFRKTIYITDSDEVAVDITGYTAQMQIRRTSQSAANFIELTTSNGGITITGAEGKIALYVSDVDTTAITEDRGIYDLEIFNGTDIVKILRGSVSILEESTK